MITPDYIKKNIPIPENASYLIPPSNNPLRDLEIDDCLIINYYPNGITYNYVIDLYQSEALKFPERLFVFTSEIKNYSEGIFRIWRKK